MYEPKGGDKPAYNPPAEPPQYGKPPTEPPQEPPKYQPGEEPEEPEKPPCDEPTGSCSCTEWEIPGGPGENEPFRRLLLRLDAILEELSEKPTDATKKFAEDLKDADKEYQGVVAIVTKYKEFFDKLDCRFAEIRTWKDEFENWLSGKLTDAEKAAIADSREKNYDAIENKICCEWITCRDSFISMLDCLEQSKKKEEEAKDDYEAVKGFEKTLTERFAELKALFDRGKAFRAEERYKAIFAVSLEFDDVVQDLSVIRDWWYARRECDLGSDDGCHTGEPTGDPRNDWTPDKFKARLICQLRVLLLAKYQRFRWQHDFLSRTSDNEKRKEACKKFRTDRRDQFIQEAEDISVTNGGGGEPTEPTGQYQGGQQPEPQPGGYQPPQTGGYQPKPGREPKTGGYEQQPPSGGYEPKPPTGGYQEKGKK